MLGGAQVIEAESRQLFDRLSDEENTPFLQQDNGLKDYPVISKLGDVFHYSSTPEKKIRIRRYRNHFDTYWIELLHPDSGQKEGNHKHIIGNIYILDLES